MQFRCGDCGAEFQAATEPGEYNWPECDCPPDHYQLLGWQPVDAPTIEEL